MLYGRNGPPQVPNPPNKEAWPRLPCRFIVVPRSAMAARLVGLPAVVQAARSQTLVSAELSTPEPSAIFRSCTPSTGVYLDGLETRVGAVRGGRVITQGLVCRSWIWKTRQSVGPKWLRSRGCCSIVFCGEIVPDCTGSHCSNVKRFRGQGDHCLEQNKTHIRINERVPQHHSRMLMSALGKLGAFR